MSDISRGSLSKEPGAEFHAHPDVCQQCEKHPFDLCPIGEKAYQGGDGTSGWRQFPLSDSTMTTDSPLKAQKVSITNGTPIEEVKP